MISTRASTREQRHGSAPLLIKNVRLWLRAFDSRLVGRATTSCRKNIRAPMPGAVQR
jgi:hypothetical protein